MTLNVGPAEPSGISHAHRIRPKKMQPIRTESSHARGSVLDGRPAARIGRIGQDTDQCVLGERTSRPSEAAVASEPRVSRLVMQMRGIEQRDQDVYVK